GLAKPDTKNAKASEDAETAGTPCYMSPEHLTGDAPPNAALDLWGLAVTTFTALTGSVAFDGPTLSDVYDKVYVKPLPVPSSVAPALPPAYDAWFAHACARDPEARWKTAAELAATFADLALRTPSSPGSARPGIAKSGPPQSHFA